LHTNDTVRVIIHVKYLLLLGIQTVTLIVLSLYSKAHRARHENVITVAWRIGGSVHKVVVCWFNCVEALILGVFA